MGKKVIDRYVKLSGELPIEPIVDAMKKGEKYFFVEGYGSVSIESIRMRTYTKGTSCVSCNLQASYFIVEKQRHDKSKKGHLNLYAKREGKRDLMMTSDHIIAKARGGSDGDLANRQPMCVKCNVLKGDKLPGEIESPSELKRKALAKEQHEVNTKKKVIKAFSTIKQMSVFVSQGMPLEKFFEYRALSVAFIMRHRHLLDNEEWESFRRDAIL